MVTLFVLMRALLFLGILGLARPSAASVRTKRQAFPPFGFPGAGLNPLAGMANALESIARYDEKKCVARMLCEVSAGGTPGGYRGSSLFDIAALRGLSDLLGAMTESPAASPMLMFGRAALLGATMRDPDRCYRSYPNCPRDPDRLVDYLNNHNGGFFRLFGGQGADQQQQQGYYQQRPTRPPYYRRGKKQRRPEFLSDEGYPADGRPDPNFRIQNIGPISGEPPIHAEPGFNFRATTPRSPFLARPSRPGHRLPPFSHFPPQPDYEDEGPPAGVDYEDYDHQPPLHHYNPYLTGNRVLYAASSRPQQGNYDAIPRPPLRPHATPTYAYDPDLYARPHKAQDDNYVTPQPPRGGQVIYATPFRPYADKLYPTTPATPNRVLYATPSRPYKKPKQSFAVEGPSLTFPTNTLGGTVKFSNKDADTRVPAGRVVFPDRTGTGELRLDTSELESPPQPSRDAKTLRFPRQDVDATVTSTQRSSTERGGGQLLNFPHE